MNVNNPPKMVGILAAMVCLTVLLAIGKLDAAAFTGLMGLIVGYLVGNGVAAKNGDPVQPTIGRKDEPPTT